MLQNILSNIIITDVYSIITSHNEAGAHSRQPSRPNWAIIIKSEGETNYIFENKTYVSNLNNICIIPKGADYEWICTARGKCTILEFECDIACNDMLYFPNTDGERFLNKLYLLEKQKNMNDPMHKLKCISETYNIILELIRSSSYKYVPGKKQLKLFPAITYIADNYKKKIKTDELAKQCSLSTIYFRQLFVDTYNISPVNYIHNLRIQKAKEMLLSEHTTISGIAEEVGYANIYDFSRAFKKYTGVSPSEYLKNKIRS